MIKPKITRRDFLKAAGAASLAWMLNLQRPAANDLPAGHEHRQSQTAANSGLPNILVILFDTWSAKNISLYGYARQTTPMLEKLAQRATVYHHHYAGSNCTGPGTASLLSGFYPWKHRANQINAQVLEPFAEHNIFLHLPGIYHRFAYTQNPLCFALLHQFRQGIDHLLKPGDLALGYHSLAEDLVYPNYYPLSEAEKLLLRSGRTPSLSLFLSLFGHYQLHQEYQSLARTYSEQYPRGLVKWSYSRETPSFTYRLEDAIDWVIEYTRTAPQPYFGYVHLLPPHTRYNPRQEFTNLFNDGWQPPGKPDFLGASSNLSMQETEKLHREYDQYIAYVDAEFGRLYQTLEKNGSLENTILVLTSDHGEIFERGIVGHTTPVLFEPLIHIPLLLFLPGQHRRVDITTPTSAVDILPTLISLAGGAPPGSGEGMPLPFQNSITAIPREIYAVLAEGSARRGALPTASFAMIQWPYKLTYYRGYDTFKNRFELYKLDEDPEETNNLYPQSLPVAQHLQETLLRAIQQNTKPV